MLSIEFVTQKARVPITNTATLPGAFELMNELRTQSTVEALKIRTRFHIMDYDPDTCLG